jgi:ubiquinone/menaquinone biosynthesis C-methylase UbiE
VTIRSSASDPSPEEPRPNPATSADALQDAFEKHRVQTEEAIASGDATAIKRLYVELGELLDDALKGDAGSAPVLSLPETGPVVLGLMKGVSGLLIDAGCGPNPAMSIALAREQPGRVMVGMDIGFGIVRIARAVAERAGIAFLPIVADLEALPFRDGVFDGGVCDDTIEHLPNDAGGVAELSRVVRSGGRVVVATPNRHSAEVLARKTRDRIAGRRLPPSTYYAASSHLREYTWPQANRLLQQSFRIRRRASVGWSDGGWKKRLATRATAYGPMRRFARMIVAEVEPARR